MRESKEVQQVQREEWTCPENRLSFIKQVGAYGQTVRGHGTENCLLKEGLKRVGWDNHTHSSNRAEQVGMPYAQYLQLFQEPEAGTEEEAL